MPNLRSLWEQITALFSPYIEQQDRAMSWGQVYSQVDSAVWNGGEDMWLYELYNDNDGSTYAIAGREGKLFRASVTTANGEVGIGEWTQVEVQQDRKSVV